MGMIEELGGYIAASTALGTLGTDIFLNVMPESTRLTVSLIEARGQSPVFTIGKQYPVHSRASVDVLVRSTAGPSGVASPVNARNRAQKVWARLTAISNQVISGTTYLNVDPEDDPHLVERDDKGRVVF